MTTDAETKRAAGQGEPVEAGKREAGRLRVVPVQGPQAPARPEVGRLIRGEFRVLAVLSVVVGAMLLLENFGVLEGVHRFWPVFPAFTGVGLVLLFYRKGKGDLVLMGIGSYLMGVSVVFFVCNFSSWGILARAWPAFVALLGVSSALASIHARRARSVLWLTGTFMVTMAVVFTLVFGIRPSLWPSSLVMFGIWILLVTWMRRKNGGDGAGTGGGR